LTLPNFLETLLSTRGNLALDSVKLCSLDAVKLFSTAKHFCCPNRCALCFSLDGDVFYLFKHFWPDQISSVKEGSFCWWSIITCRVINSTRNVL